MRSRATLAAAVAILLAGAALRTAQYGSSISMSSDEIALALNVTDRSFGELLFHPLLHDQVAPPGFLVLERLSVALGGDRELAFRFFPYLFSLAALLLFWRVAMRYLNPATMLAALIVFALSPALVLYASVAKQYSADMMATLFLLWATLKHLTERLSLRESAVLGVAGGLALLLSHPGVLVGFGLGVLLLIHGWRRGSSGSPIVICGGWSIGAATTTYVSLTTLSPSTSRFMDVFWARDFMPPPWTGVEELLWVPARVVDSISFMVALINSPTSLPAIALFSVYGLLLLLGFPYLVKRDALTSAVLAVPVCTAVVAAAVRLLPLSGRLSLYAGPSLVIACFAGFDLIRRWLPVRADRLPSAAALGLATLPAIALLARDTPPMVRSGTRPVVQAMSAHWRPGDELIAASGQWAWLAAEYYGRREGLHGWTRIGSRGGKESVEDYLRDYLRRIDEFRGSSRVWLYLENTVPCVEEMLHGYLGSTGTRLFSARYRLSARDHVSAHLYDLSDPARLSSADAETYELPACAGVESMTQKRETPPGPASPGGTRPSSERSLKPNRAA